jgi:ABC-2 type transport system ATP-binding protein
MIAAQNLYKSFGETTAVAGVDLNVASGEIYGLVGPDGAGKTTTIRLLCGALRPSTPPTGRSTRIQIGAYDLQRQPELARAQVGYLAQRFALYEDLTVLENLRFFAEIRGLPSSEWRPRCQEILEFVGLAAFLSRRAGQLSGGMKQKLGLAAALVHRPQVLLLDEPTTGVDPVTRQDFWQLIIRLVSSGTVSVLVSTPSMDEAARCLRVGFLHRGKLIIEGTPEALRQRLHGQVLEVRGVNLRQLRDLAQTDPDVQVAHLFGDRLHLRVNAGQGSSVERRIRRMARAAKMEAVRIRPITPQLEDVFMAWMEGQR